MASVDTDRDRDGEGEKESERYASDLYIRTGWADAITAFDQVEKGKATGDRGSLWIRARLQKQLRSLGVFLEAHAGKVLFVSLLVIATFCVGLKSTTFHSSIDQLWVSTSGIPSNTDNEGISGSHYSQTQQSTIDLLSTHQMVVQTSSDPDANLLHPRGLLEHLALVQQAAQVTINVFDQTWRLKDLCQSPSIPTFDAHFIEQMFENMLPCSIITPLDCFWEGSKLLGPDYPVNIPMVGSKVKWTNLNPAQLVADMKKMEFNFDYHMLENYLRRARITTGYQEKPCLNPKDSDCPNTAPNKNSSQIPDIGAELTSGCYGFAAKYMHWPEDLLVGGTIKNKTGHIKQAKALQTVVQLMDAHEMYEYWVDTWKVHHVGWSQEKAAIVLDMWQKRFSQEIRQLTQNNFTSPSYQFNTFSTATLNDILKQHLQFDIVKLGIALVIMLVYSWLVDSSVAALGVLLLVGSTAAGLGLCSILGFPMNVLTVHVLPFVVVGMSLHDVFLLLNTYHKCQQTSESVKRSALNVVSSAIISAASFFTAAIVPVPAFRIFVLQCAILVVFNTAALLIVIPALMSLESRCKKAAFFCFGEVPAKHAQVIDNNNDQSKKLLHSELICPKRNNTMASLLSYYMTSVILNPVVKIILFFGYAVLIIFCIINGLKLEYDINLSMFLPRNTQEYNFLEAQNKHFGFYSFYLVTTEFEYPLNQRLLYEYHSSLTKVPNVLKDSNGGLNMNDFWLANFRDFLIDLQDEFDDNLAKNCLNNEKWFPNATEKAVLAFKLLSQTGVVEFPVDKTVILKKRLVRDGIIDSSAFYNYLSVWSSNDQLSYSSSKSSLTPKPFQYYSSKTEFDLKIPKSQPLVYTQMPFYLKNLKTTSKIVDTLNAIRSISESYNSRGLKNYPLGLIFAYFDQFLFLDYLLITQLVIISFVTLVLSCLLLKWTKVWCKIFSIGISMLILSIVNISSMTSIFIALHWALVCRNVSLILSGYVSAIGNRERRMKLSLDLYCSAIIKGDVALLLCILIWITSEFDFIRNNLLFVGIAIIVTSMINGLIFFPILLTFFGPSADIIPLLHSDRISTPPPISSPVASRQQFNGGVNSSNSAKAPKRNQPTTKATREPSLTTITEESCNQSIVVQPEVVVEYSNPNDSGSSSSGQYTTKVTATANIKVEVVAPMYRERGRHRSENRGEDRSCRSHRTCSEKRTKTTNNKCGKDDTSENRGSSFSRERGNRRCDYRDDCQMYRDREPACRHSCCLEEDRDRMHNRRHYCDGNDNRRSPRNKRDSDSSGSDRELDKDHCWMGSEKTIKISSNSDESSSTTSSTTSSCTKLPDHEQHS